MSLAERLAAVESAPPGPRTAAIFDFDGTVIGGFSALPFMQERGRRGQIGPLEVMRLALVGVRGAAGRGDLEALMRTGVRSLAGRTQAELDRLGRELTRSAIGGGLVPAIDALIAAHQRRGHTVVIATSALPYQVEPLARELGVDHVLCTRPRVVDGRLDGTIAGAILWGPGKAAAVRALCSRENLWLGDGFGYANGDEDAAFLAAVGHPCAVNPQAGLLARAERAGWPVERFAKPRPAGVTDTVRTLAAYAGMAASFGVGAGLGLLNRSRRDAANLSMSIGSDVALALAGVRVEVAGERHLWSARPAVFVFNHQSWLDGLVVMRLLRGDITGVAKREVARQPGIGQFARLAHMALVDRSDGRSARAALAPAVARLKEGYSIVIAPEGTRSTTPRLGPFKKGAFHLAMQGRVPIVPIVLRNAGRLMWRGSTVIRPGTVDVVVHAPVDTRGWRRADLDAHVAQVRGLFVDTLADWDAARSAATPAPRRRSRGR